MGLPSVHASMAQQFQDYARGKQESDRLRKQDMKCKPISLVLEELWKELSLWGAIESLRKIKTNEDGNTGMKE